MRLATGQSLLNYLYTGQHFEGVDGNVQLSDILGRIQLRETYCLNTDVGNEVQWYMDIF